MDNCGGHGAPGCIYHHHAFIIEDTCAADGKWNQCEWIGTMLDGFKLYSHCKKSGSSSYLKSCYKLKTSSSDEGSTKNWQHVSGTDCDLDIANGYDFTGKGIKDPDGKEITGYGYVASEDYPWVMPYMYGGEDTCDTLVAGVITGGKFCVSGVCSENSLSKSGGFTFRAFLPSLLISLLILLK